MAYDDRYEGNSRYMERNRGYSSRNNQSRGFFRGGDDDRDFSSRRDSRREHAPNDDRMGGWAGTGRTSAYDRNDRNERHFGADDYNRGLPMDETRSLIASNKVEGTPVYGRDDDRLGSIRNVMIDKYSGEVRYAVLSHSSGFLGMNESYLPIEWDELRYDERKDGYRINMTEDQLRHRIDRHSRDHDRGSGRVRDRRHETGDRW